DLVPSGFHAQILSANGSVYIDPYQRGDDEHYVTYYRRDAARASGQENTIGCTLVATDEEINAAVEITRSHLSRQSVLAGEVLRTYRVAIGATGEYTSFHGGTVAAGLAAINVALNRINGIYERDVAVRMQLVANNDQIVFTDPATDPYTNNNGFTMLSENQAVCDAVIGSANYDIGHVFSTGGGGVAYLGVVCVNNYKARGVTGLPAPIGDVFYVDYVSHEMGHQYNATHTFNGSSGNCSGGNRTGSTAYEPGSGTTIMAYAGICAPQNIQNNSDDYFHWMSLSQIFIYTDLLEGSQCPVETPTGNTPPVAVAVQPFAFTHVPISTPFMLTGSATDIDGDDLTYCWEEADLGPTGHPDMPVGDAAIFRTFQPVDSPTRVFPQWSDIVNNTHTLGEILPTYERNLRFTLTVRDNHAGGGGYGSDQINFRSDAAAGPFLVTSPNGGETIATSSYTVTWNVANTTNSNVNCQTVDILLSTDGGFKYPVTLLAGTPNDGSETVTFTPAHISTTARVMVKAADNVFLDISNGNFEITAPVPVAITGFSASSTNEGISLEWDVFADEDFAGFRIYRSTGDALETAIVDAPLSPDTRAFTDREVTPATTYTYTLCAVMPDGNLILSSPASATTPTLTTQLLGNHPNPFNPTTTISFTLAETIHANLTIYDVEGRLVRSLVDRRMGDGLHKVVWDGRDARGALVSSGVYFYRLFDGKRVLTKKMV
ncbi:MAG: T9SS type A sorting domain-containing protein, partial [Candidatus Krumholzibacteria bacterium]|nr:T9SS type A sorting domain-containing protein [Candidatus Krumholzibacteria bacterium]